MQLVLKTNDMQSSILTDVATNRIDLHILPLRLSVKAEHDLKI
jgi:hypothetical protein